MTANPVARDVLHLAQESEKTKGARAVFGVFLMFMILCGGVWMLLQSSFGPKQAYLISGVAFWGSWLVLSTIWLTGVPGISVLGIPESTPKYYGPQGIDAHWVVAEPNGETKRQEQFDKYAKDHQSDFIAVDESVTAAAGDKAAAENAATQVVGEEIAVELGVGADEITVPTVIEIKETKLARTDGKYRYAQVTFGPAAANATDTDRVKELKGQIKPKTISLVLDPGNLATPTYIALGLFSILFLAHLVMLVRYELNRVPQPQGVPERATAGV